jgi:hypothetical protein
MTLTRKQFDAVYDDETNQRALYHALEAARYAAIRALEQRVIALTLLAKTWQALAAQERTDDWCNTPDKAIWKSIHQERADVFERCAREVLEALDATKTPREP